jgi:hypothetical protein
MLIAFLPTSNRYTSSCYPLRLSCLLLLKLALLQTWIKEHSGAVDRCVIRTYVVGVKLLLCSVDVVAEVMLIGSKASVKLTLYKIVYPLVGKLSCCRRRNITLGGRSYRGGFTDMCTLGSPRVSWSY